MLRWALNALSPEGDRAALSILIFHRVMPVRDELFPGEVTAAEFDEICRWTSGWFNVLPLPEAVERLKKSSLPARAACITFDDGYADNHEVAAPILERYSLPATFFVASGFLDGGCMWNDRVIEAVRRTNLKSLDLRRLEIAGLQDVQVHDLESKRSAVRQLLSAIKYLPTLRRTEIVQAVVESAGIQVPVNLMMSSQQVRALHHRKFSIGAHTVSHPILSRLDAAHAGDEIAFGRAALEALIADRVTVFAYPNGRPGEDYTERDVRLVRAQGFGAAVTTAWGVGRQHSDLFELPRFTPWDRSKIRFGARLLANMRGWSSE